MNNSTSIQDLNSVRNTLLNGVYHLYTVLSAILYINIFLMLILSTLWAFYFIQKIWKDYRYEKMHSKLRNSFQEQLWLNRMQNFKSNRIKNIILLAICVSETVMTVIIVYDKFRDYVFNETYNPEKDAKTGLLVFISCGSFVSYRIYATLAMGECVLTFLIRILTQYMVYQYSYYKPYLNLKVEFYISITCYIPLIFSVLVLKLEKLFLICCLILLFYELTWSAIAGRKLSLLLRQRLHDSRQENQGNSVIRYYEIVRKEFRMCFSILLVSIFLQSLAIAILHTRLFFLYYGYYYLVLPLLATVLFTFGNGIQMLPYLIVSLRSAFHHIRNRRKHNHRSFEIPTMKRLIEKNYFSYQTKMEYSYY